MSGSTTTTTTPRQSRVWLKFIKHKPALISLVVIGIYVLAGIAVVCGMITVKDTANAYGAPFQPGFGLSNSPEQRLDDAEWYLNKLRIPLGSIDAKTALGEFPVSDLQAADRSVDELRTALATGDDLLQQLKEVSDLDTTIASGSADGLELQQQIVALEETVAGMLQLQPDVGGLRRWMHLSLGTDRLGRSNFLRAVYSIRVAILVGLVTGIVSVLIGAVLGLAAGYFGGWVDVLITWLYSTFASIPNIVLLILLVYVFREGTIDTAINEATGGLLSTLLGGSRLDSTLIPVYVAFCATFWIGPCRVIRGEAMKLREQEYVQAAQVLGYGNLRILFRHLLPNVSHLMLINFSLLFIGAIKSEVILSFLGLGVTEGTSWGVMISFAKDEVVNGNFWQIGVATSFMFVLVLAFNILSDAMQDILDPKHV